MEDLSRKLPALTGLILNHLDDQSLISCKIASRELSKFLEGTKLLKIRIIRTYRGLLEDSSVSQNRHDRELLINWEKLVAKGSVEIVDRLSIATQWCYKQETFPKYKCISEEGSEKQVQKIVDNLPLTITLYKKQWTPLLVATYYGCLNLCKFIIEITGYNSIRNDGHTALHLAAHNQNAEISQWAGTRT